MTRNIALDIDEFHFSFCGVLDAYVFDEKQKSSQHFHGMPMKAVDIFLETDDKFVFIEVKAFPADLALEYSHSLFSDHECVNHLKNSLKYKFRDSYLYKHAEGTSFNKDVHYLCLLTFDTPINQFLSNCLRVELPIQRGPRWVQSLATSVHVFNPKQYLNNFSKEKIMKPFFSFLFAMAFFALTCATFANAPVNESTPPPNMDGIPDYEPHCYGDDRLIELNVPATNFYCWKDDLGRILSYQKEFFLYL